MAKNDLPKNHVPDNSSMAINEEEVKNLGKQMEHRRTGEVLKEDYDKMPDPIQYQEKKK
ncbi:hypothetical protein [Mesobacillus campisalis]|uniref:hypothetical protein n=1 Tax=Mesobacillus campisalis TaxID=1408103 RepID=UPI000A59D5AA|nr:hypothetical protein [Mesobacillus campisalis]